MLFTSYEFIAFFFLLTVLYYLIPGRYQWMLLLAAGYVFYWAADPDYLIFLLAVTVLTYVAALLIDRSLVNQKKYLKIYGEGMDRQAKKEYKALQGKKRKRIIVWFLVMTLSILASAKYINFFILNLNGILRMMGSGGQISFINLLLPLGISFYTFQAIGYMLDVYRGDISAEKNFFRYALFVSFFPQLVQGPISRFQDLARTMWEPHPFRGKNLQNGLLRVLWGYFKKLVVADRLFIAVSLLLGQPEEYCGAYAVVTMVFYTVQLYADFTGGIDITIGMAQVLGIEVQENFRRPYFSKSLKEYWRRWHISMSSWFRDYVFYPVSASRAIQRISKAAGKLWGTKAGKRLPVYLSSFVVWLATGIWHGASWNFVVWGLLNWVVLMVSEELEPLYARFQRKFALSGRLPYRLFQVGRTFLLVCILNLFDCYEKVSVTLKMLASVFGAENWKIFADGSLLRLGLTAADYIVLAAAVLMMVSVSLAQRRGSVCARVAGMRYPVQAAVWMGLFLMVLLFGTYGIGYDAGQFIYNRF